MQYVARRRNRYQQFLDRLVVSRATFALIADGSVPLEAVALQRLQNCLGGARLLSRRVNVFDTQQPLAVQ